MAVQSARVATKSPPSLDAQPGRVTPALRTEEQPTPPSSPLLFGSAERIADAQLKIVQASVGVLCERFAMSSLLRAGRIMPLVTRVGLETSRSATISVLDAARDVILGSFNQFDTATREMATTEGAQVDTVTTWDMIQASLDYYSATAEALATCSTTAAKSFASQWKAWLPEAV